MMKNQLHSAVEHLDVGVVKVEVVETDVEVAMHLLKLPRNAKP